MTHTKTKITEEMRKLLRADFPSEAYKKHPTKTFLTTLKAMYITERLNNVFGVGRWTIDIEIIERTADYVLMQGEFKSTDFDVVIPKQFGGHKTSGTNTEIADGFKSALTDCQSKIASYLEIGIDMFKGLIAVGASKKKTTIIKNQIDPAILTSITNAIGQCKTLAALSKIWTNNKEFQSKDFFIKLKNDRKKILTDNGITE